MSNNAEAAAKTSLFLVDPRNGPYNEQELVTQPVQVAALPLRRRAHQRARHLHRVLGDCAYTDEQERIRRMLATSLALSAG